MLSRLGIRQKVFALFTIVALTPLVVINVIWLRSSQGQLKQAAANRQSILLDSVAKRVNESLDAKIDSVVTNSQDSNVTQLSLELAKIKLLQFASQDTDVRRIALVDKTGDEKIVIKDGAISKDLKNVKTATEFDVVTLLGNAAALGEVGFVNNEPQITISVPLLDVNKLGDQDLTTAQALARRYGSDINGALIVTVSLSNLWKYSLNTKLGTNGYVYLINNKGEVIAHKNDAFRASNPNIKNVTEVRNALSVLKSFDLEGVANSYTPVPTVSTSETGVRVLSSSFPISRTKWAVIGEEPVASVYSATNKISAIALAILAISIPISVGFVLLSTRNIVMPIRELTKDAVRMGGGDFSHHAVVKGHDELATMASTFNKMGNDLQSLLDKYKEQNINLVAERTKLQAILDTITDGVVVLDQHFGIVLVNKTISTLTMVANPDLLAGKPWLATFPLTHEGVAFTNELLNGELQYFHDVTLQVNETPKYIDMTAIRLHNDPNGIAYILTIHDITQRRELENMKLDFVSMAAHELRTPLTALSGYLDLVSRNQHGDEKNLQFLEQARANATMLDSLINNLLSLSHIERNALKLNMKVLDWKAVITDEVNNHSFSAKAKHLTVSSELPDEPVYVWGDEFALREVVGNLISNAFHYTADGGSVKVKVTADPTGVKTTVSDTGIGIAPDAIDKLFAKYYRAEGGLTTNSQGTGIGLFISKTIVAAHSGTIGVKSELGKGSDFYFTLAAYDSTSSKQTVDNSSPANKRSKVDWF